MFIGKHLVYVELHKTGCTSIRNLLLEHVGGFLTNKHSVIVEHRGGPPVVGSIRNPWDWYVSLWSYGCGKEGGIYQRTTGAVGGPALPWNEVTARKEQWQAVYEDPHDAGNFRRWLAMLHEPEFAQDVDPLFAGSSISNFAGLLTFRFLYFSTPWRTLEAKDASGGFHDVDGLRQHLAEHGFWVDAIRTESISDDVVRVLVDTGFELDDRTEAAIHARAQTRMNRSLRQATAHYYDPESIELVRRRDELVITRFGYEPPQI